MITELSLERVEFTCGHCWNQWSLDYDVQRYRDEAGRDWEYFYLDGVAVNSPYSTEGALRCPVCGRRWVGHIHARRPIPTAPGPSGTPRRAVADAAEHRPERYGAPRLGAYDHSQPRSGAPPCP